MSPLGLPGDLAGFPEATLSTRRPLWRIHRRDRAPFWFGSDGSGRFDLPPPGGTCYAAEEPLGAFVETFRAAGGVGPGDLAAVRLARLRTPRPVRLADTTVARARRFGITLEIGATPDYELTQAWARALAGARFGGVRYRVRHDPSARLVAVALFGDAGARDWPAESEALDDLLVTEAGRRFGILVGRGALR